MEWHHIFPTHMHVKVHGVVLHHLTTLFDNTNAVRKPEHGDQCTVNSAKHLWNSASFTAKLQIMYYKLYCQNTAEILQRFFH